MPKTFDISGKNAIFRQVFENIVRSIISKALLPCHLSFMHILNKKAVFQLILFFSKNKNSHTMVGEVFWGFLLR
jgi:hypothetical protein